MSKHTNHFGSNEPCSAQLNDLWFRFEKDNKVRLLEYKHNQWKPVTE